MKLNKKPMVLNVNWKCIYETMTYLILEKKKSCFCPLKMPRNNDQNKSNEQW